jgi:hypothetical protein
MTFVVSMREMGDTFLVAGIATASTIYIFF